MLEAIRLGGFVAAHAIWSVEDGDTLIPMGLAQFSDGAKDLSRFYDDDLAVAAARASQWLHSNEMNAMRAVTAVDGFITACAEGRRHPGDLVIRGRMRLHRGYSVLSSATRPPSGAR
jgi:hypothetical protein